MTREEAIKTLKENSCNICSFLAKDMESCSIAYCDNRAAIRTLEQEPCEDCVSREELKKWLDMNFSFGGALRKLELFDRLDKELPPVTPKGVTVTDFADKCRECGKLKNGEWIPVSEKLPEDYQRVLITVVRYDGERNVRVVKYRNKFKTFDCLENHEQWEVGEEGLLAWRPLPEPYQEEKE